MSETPLSTAPAGRRAGPVSHEALWQGAAKVLRTNDAGQMTRAAPQLYPHMWSWDAAFIAIGLARVDVQRAMTELDTLLRAQWSNGMIPHIVFAQDRTDYFPDAGRWGAEASPHAPKGVRTSGICQPPVHALALQRILEAAESGVQSGGRSGREFLEHCWPRLLAWHRWIAAARDPQGNGRVTIHHGWESGMDNSPRWDGPYSRVQVGAGLPSYRRRDTEVVADSAQRPSDLEYDRYLWLVEEMRQAEYDDALVAQRCSFAVEDVFFTAITALACDVLVDLGRRHAMPESDVAELAGLAERFRQGVAASVGADSGLARDRDLRTGDWLAVESLAGFAPLLCGGLDAAREGELRRLFAGRRWAGNPRLLTGVPPTTSPDSAEFRSKEYWRGPQWPVVGWLFGWAFARHGWEDEAAFQREQGLRLVSDGSFGEYYEPLTGQPLGSRHQSWTAAVTLDWLA